MYFDFQMVRNILQTSLHPMHIYIWPGNAHNLGPNDPEPSSKPVPITKDGEKS